jgi:hypothetical protein
MTETKKKDSGGLPSQSTLFSFVVLHGEHRETCGKNLRVFKKKKDGRTSRASLSQMRITLNAGQLFLYTYRLCVYACLTPRRIVKVKYIITEEEEG